MAETDTFAIEQSIFDKVVDALESENAPWHGQSVIPRNLFNKNHYRGMNVVACWSQGSASQAWGTLKQWTDRGYRLREWEFPTVVRFYMPVTFTKNGIEQGWITRAFQVYASEQVEGGDVALRKEDAVKVAASPAGLLDWALSLPVTIERVDGNRIEYDRVRDTITLPADFRIRDDVDATRLGHAIIAATAHKGRADRKTPGELEGDEAKAYEALICDIGAAFILAHFGLCAEATPDMVKQMGLWVDLLRRGAITLRLAANEAGKALRWLPDFPKADDDVVEALAPLKQDTYTVMEGVIARNKLAKLVKAGIVPDKAARAFKALITKRTGKTEEAA